MLTTPFLLLPNFLFSPPTKPIHGFTYPSPSKRISPLSTTYKKPNPKSQRTTTMVHCNTPNSEIDCVGTGADVECVISDSDPLIQNPSSFEMEKDEGELKNGENEIWKWILLVSPFFFWGTAMVGVIPKAGPFFVSSFRLIPSGFLLVGFALAKGRKQPAGVMAWLSIAVFAAVDATCFQGFLAEGLQRTSAGLGSFSRSEKP